MSKYFMVRPNEFWEYDYVDINGEYPHVNVDDFALSKNKKTNSEFNYLIFEVPCKEGRRVKYGNEAIELFTGNKFDLTVVRDPETNEDIMDLKSDELGLYLSKPLSIDEVVVKNSKVSGLIEYMKDDKELFKNYCYCLDTTFDAARFYKTKHDETVHGLNNNSKKQLRRKFNRIVKY